MRPYSALAPAVITWYSRMASMEIWKALFDDMLPPKNGSLLSPPSMFMEELTPRWPAMARPPREGSMVTWGVRVARLVKERLKLGMFAKSSGLTKAAVVRRPLSTWAEVATTSTTALVSGARRMVKGAASPRLRVTLMLAAVWKPALVTVTV